ncbi:hypothetical protein IWQ61_007396 [Dispira simplex]|nr:hypothetical protein IWQ61_007396 [Dispira simplex]
MLPSSTTPSPSGGAVPFPRLSGADVRLRSKRTMEIQAEEGIHPGLIVPKSNGTFSPFNSLGRSQTPEPKPGGGLLGTLSSDSTTSTFPAAADVSDLPGTLANLRRSRADTLPSSLSQLNLRTLSNSTPNPEASKTEEAPAASSLRTSASSSNLRSSLNRTRGTSLSLPPTAIKEAFGTGVYTSTWLAGGLEDTAMPSPIATRNQIEEMNSSLAKTLDYLGIDDACMSPLEPKRHEFPITGKPFHPAVLELQGNAGRIRSFSMNNAGVEDGAMLAPSSLPKVPSLVGNPSRLRTFSHTYKDGGYHSRIPSGLCESVTATHYMNGGLVGDDNSIYRSASPSTLSRAPPSRSHTPVMGGMNGDPISRSHTPKLIDGIFGDSESGLAHGASSDGTVPTRSLWVGNADPSLTMADFMGIFSPFGAIESLRLLPDKECAFINFARVEDAIKARETMQNTKIGNCMVRVGFGKGDNYANVDAQAMQPTRAIWVGNISANTSSAALQSVFSAFGPIESARVLTHKNCGFVNFEKLEDAVRAKKAMNGKEIADSVVRIGYAKVPSKSDPNGRSRVTSTVVPMPSQFLTPWHTLVPTPDSSLNPEEVLETGANLLIDEQLVAYNYLHIIPPLPESNGTRRFDQSRLREIRKKLEGTSSPHEVTSAFEELYDVCVDLCTDYIGNTIIQKFMDKCTAEQKQQLIEAVAPHTASIGTHKNGTWAIQKMIECADTPGQILPFVASVKPTTPPLMLDQLGNYVVQCCLRFGPQRNQFIFDAIHARCWEIAQGRFGARAIRTCLEHQETTCKQKKLVIIALVNNALALITNPNGTLLINWLVDSSGFLGRYRVLAPRLADHLAHLCTHKLGVVVMQKILNQRTEPDARDLLFGRLFFDPHSSVLEDVLSDHVHGVTLIHKILAGTALSDTQKQAIAENVKNALLRLQVLSIQGYRRLLEEIDHILHTSLVSMAASGNPSLGAPPSMVGQVPHGLGYPNGGAYPSGGMYSMGGAQTGTATASGTNYPYSNMLLYNPVFNPYTYGMMGMPPVSMVGTGSAPMTNMMMSDMSVAHDPNHQRVLMSTLSNGHRSEVPKSMVPSTSVSPTSGNVPDHTGSSSKVDSTQILGDSPDCAEFKTEASS